MDKTLLSVGLDVGTTTTQVIFSRLIVTNQASAFTVPRMAITARQVIYKSPVHFTPLLGKDLVDARALAELVKKEYALAGVRPEQVDTGAIIITGETSRKENARQVLRQLSGLAGDFVVTTAGPHLESRLAALGSGAAALSEKEAQPVLHMDIGGGTSNLCLLHRGKILRTGCLNVGGRLVKLEQNGALSYVSPVLGSVFPYRPGDIPGEEALTALAETLTHALESAAGLRPPDERYYALLTREAGPWQIPEEDCILSFSGGVAECVREDRPSFAFGDLGVLLGKAIRNSRLRMGNCHIGRETIRATVIGAGCHSTQLSGSTVFFRNVTFPLKDLPVLRIKSVGELASRLAAQEEPEEPAVIALETLPGTGYRQLRELAQILGEILKPPLYIALRQDAAKALGQALAAKFGADTPIVCLDGLELPDDGYLDVLAPAGPALPVVVKTLVFERNTQ